MFSQFKALHRSVAICCIVASFGAAPTLLLAQDQSSPSSTAPDNSARNKAHNTTADQQKNGKSDVDITAEIRKSVVADNSLSTYAHNVKIITKNGAVTLKGPVHSEEEKQTIAAKAADVVGQGKVTNQLTVKQ
jgi:hyperosmotically inducible periplasmic protein